MDSTGTADDNALGSYLKDRRMKLDPASFGFPLKRRRTPGLRREEVAQRANVSATWYTWLEQGRGGAPSAEVLDRIARALVLKEAEREHLYLLALGRPPEMRYQPPTTVTSAVQRVLDSMADSPAIVKTLTWDIVAWNAAATVVLGNFDALPQRERNGLRRIFLDPESRKSLPDWEDNARFAVSVFRIGLARADGDPDAAALAAELQAESADFRHMWSENDVRNFGAGLKRFHHPTTGDIMLEYSAFDVDGAGGLTMVVFTPATEKDRKAVEKLVREKQ